MQPLCQNHLIPWLNTLNASAHVYVGYSGGMDSTVLLHCLASLLPHQKMTAVHVNHGISRSSDQWAVHCQSFCDNLGVNFIHEQVVVDKVSGGVEQAARQQRYKVFFRLLKTKDLLLLAHHQDDQVETILYRLLRGSGPKGLGGMPAQRALGQGALLRPLLTAAQTEISDYAQSQQLGWVEDESNSETNLDRNFLRHKISPVLGEHWSDYRQRIVRSSLQCESAQTVLDEVARDDLIGLNESPARIGWRIDLDDFKLLSSGRQSNILRYWAVSRGLVVPGHTVVTAVRKDLLSAQEDAMPEVHWSGGSFRRFRQSIYLLENMPSPPPEKWSIPWDVEKVLSLFDGSQLSATCESGSALVSVLGIPIDAQVDVRFREGGERCQPLGRTHSAPLKKILQEYGLEPWLRNRLPLVFINGELAAAGDLFICAPFVASNDQPGYFLRWQLN